MKKLTVTIGIPTFNEEKNIKTLLQSVIDQNQEGFVIESILVFSDASTDSTVKKVQSMMKKNDQIKILLGTERKGKYVRVNELFKRCKSDVIVILDADIGLVGNNFLCELLKPFSINSMVQLVAAHQMTIRPDNFIGKIIYANFLVWDYVRWSIPDFHSSHNYFGSATAYRGSFAKRVHIPPNLSDPHLYIYLMADQMNGFAYAKKAVIREWTISTITDLNKLLRRSIGKRDTELEKIFGKEFIEHTRYVPKKYKVLGVIKAFKEEPFFTPLSFLITIYMKFLPLIPKDKTATWDIVSSTKKRITKKDI